MRQSPFEHPIPFVVMVLTTGAMLFDFAFFREQTCLVACPIRTTGIRMDTSTRSKLQRTLLAALMLYLFLLNKLGSAAAVPDPLKP